MNILLIIFNNDIENPDVFKDRIKALGDTFYIFDNIVFVETDSSTKDVYNKISSNEYEQNSMLILHIRNEMLGFWGRMNTKLWTWLSEKEEKTKDGLTDNYIAEIYKLDMANKSLSEELEKLKTEKEDNQKIIENLYQQISSLKEQLKK
jgi:hypothetical protein